jgi:hypothetical protein
MLLRVVLFLGVALVVLAGGAVGWSYWQSLPQQVAAVEAPNPQTAAPRIAGQAPPATVAAPAQNWLIDRSGGLVSRDTAQAFLRQDRFVEDRQMVVTFRAPLDRLLSPGEVLPAAVFHEALADVRAPALADGLCAPLLDGFANGCALHAARLVDGSYDPETVSARFQIELVFTLKPEVQPMPDPAAHVLQRNSTDAEIIIAGDIPTVDQLMRDAVTLAMQSCAQKTAAGLFCRIGKVELDWNSPDLARVEVERGWLAPLPTGMYPAPPLF